VISFDGTSSCSDGPASTTLGGLNVSSDGAACFAYHGWSFADNGSWFALPALADASLSGTTTITIDLGASYSSAWGFVDYGLGCSGFDCTTYGNDPTITALDENKNVIESFDLSASYVILGSNNEFEYEAGRTVGFSESSADIRYFQIGGDNIAITNISTMTPEPATFALTALALIGLCFAWRRDIKSRGCDFRPPSSPSSSL
jgi:hypothetical protein